MITDEKKHFIFCVFCLIIFFQNCKVRKKPVCFLLNSDVDFKLFANLFKYDNYHNVQKASIYWDLNPLNQTVNPYKFYLFIKKKIWKCHIFLSKFILD